MLERKDRIQDITTTTGTGTIDLNGTSDTGYNPFVSELTDGATVRYLIQTDDKSEWENGIGVFTDGAPDTLTRVTVSRSSNANAKVDFTAGTKKVYCVPIADDLKDFETGWNLASIRNDEFEAIASKFNDPTYRFRSAGDLTGKYSKGMKFKATQGGGDNASALLLDASKSQYASIADVSQTGLDITGDISVKFKMKWNGANGAFQRIISKDDNSTNRSYSINIDTTNQFRVDYFSDNSTYTEGQSDLPLDRYIGEWINVDIAVDVSAAKIRIFINGVEQAVTNTSSAATSIQNSSSSFHISGISDVGTTPFNGVLSDIAIFSKELTEEEVNGYMNRNLLGTETDLQGYWKLDGDLLDETSNNNDLTASGSPVFVTDIPPKLTNGDRLGILTDIFYPQGDNVNSLDLELSSTQYAYIADASQSGLDLSGSFTVAAWVKIESLGAKQAIISKWRGSTGLRSYEFNIGTNNELTLAASGDGSTTFVVANQANFVDSDDVGTWVHLAAKLDITTQTITFYKNGKATLADNYANRDSISSLHNSTTQFRIGAEGDLGTDSNPFDGKISEVQVWSRLLTQKEIVDSMRGGTDPNAYGLEGYWQFDNDYTDETVNGNDLTAVNSPVFSADVPAELNSNYTYFDVFCGTDYGFSNETITAVYYSTEKAPFGFPQDMLNLDVSVWANTPVSADTGVDTLLTLDGVTKDVANCWDVASGGFRAKLPGKHNISINAGCTLADGQRLWVKLFKNGVEFKKTSFHGSAASGLYGPFGLSVRLEKEDILEIYVNQTSGSTRTFGGGPTINYLEITYEGE